MMQDNSLKIDLKIVWIMALVSLVVTIIGALSKILGGPPSEGLVMAGTILSSATWILIFADMLSHTFYHKTFWIISLFILPPIVPLLYLYQRERLIHINQGFSLNHRSKP